MANIDRYYSKILKTTLFAGIVAISFIFFNLYSTKKSVLYGDALGYYSYLPTFFIHHNVESWEKLPADSTIPANVVDYLHDIEYSFPRSPKGKVVIQYSYGVALLYSPFFLAAKTLDSAQMPNGYTVIYERAIRIGNLFYLLLGLWFCYLILLKLCSRFIASLTCFLLFIGTNLFWFGVVQAGMAHIPLFSLVALLTYTSFSLLESHSHYKVLLIFFLIGLITLIRPSDFIVCIVPIAINWGNRKKLFSKTILPIWLLGFFFFLLPLIPQLILWKQLTGSYFYYTYGNQGFHFLKPHLWRGLFSYQNGWLIYSPLFLLSFFGVLTFWKNSVLRRLALFLFPIYIYVTYSWYNPEYINGLGSRPMLHIYPICGIFLAGFFQKVQSKKWHYQLSSIFVLAAVCYNILISQKQITDRYWSENGNASFLKSTFLKKGLDYNDLVCFDNGIVQPDTSDFVIKEMLVRNDTLKIEENNEFPDYQLNFLLSKWQSVKTKNWIKCSVRANAIWPVPDLYQNHLLVFKITKDTKTLFWKAVRVNNKLGVDKNGTALALHNCIINDWDDVSFLLSLPEGLPPGALASLSVWNIGKKPLVLGGIAAIFY